MPISGQTDQAHARACLNPLGNYVGLAGVKAKAKAYLDSVSYDVMEISDLATSLAEDAERICARAVIGNGGVDVDAA